jgi:transketolase
MDIPRSERLKALALKVREHIIRMSGNGGCFIGASLSCTDLIVYLYSEFLNISPPDIGNPERDYLFLSKGHDVPALYGTLAELGFIDVKRLQNHLSSDDSIYWHPNNSIPGIEFHSGSLGHLPSVAIGVAMDCKMKKQNNLIVVIVGDGEMNEGSFWEALLVANAYKLDNLIIVVDRNHFQANIKTESLIPLESLEKKFEAFNCIPYKVDGHKFEKLDDTFKNLDFNSGKVNVVIADTKRGKGLPSIEERADRWFCNFNEAEVDALLKELHGETGTKLESETLTVR